MQNTTLLFIDPLAFPFTRTIQPQNIAKPHLWVLEISSVETFERDELHLADGTTVRD
ncbi:hypothetical protein [Pedosphaera parvula]|uniref:Uncharacterized protein n=1 Tax=Pedosphaera parvula (strain Ellin514) TaxID=320771 RepID=B9XK74_PEDPL|nr:hypothetical protein [Pedosphaera parvula]EEF59712.1 hypothetical protein Cflav_PD2533 [Pedosphaera parvula Ellin514]